MSNNNEKVMEISHSDVLNALFHQQLHKQHFATQESVDNLKERFIDFSARTDSNFEKVESEIKEVRAEIKHLSDKTDESFKEVRAEIKEVRTEIKELSNKTDEGFKNLSNRMDTQFRWVLGLMVSGIIALVAQNFI